jgi:prepilin-type processing-associated H-X9-DG protein/prepilin-type N-terminal cleavage/methylation domain-containing protein
MGKIRSVDELNPNPGLPVIRPQNSGVSVSARGRSRLRAAFTLVELLVVVGIIAILIAILLPSLRKAMQSANTVKCLSNLRQMGMGIQFYANDNHGLCAPSAMDTTQIPQMGAWVTISAGPPPVGQVFWCQSAANYFAKSKSSTGAGGSSIWAGVWNCPSGPNPYSVYLPQFGNYGINQNIGGQLLDVNGFQYINPLNPALGEIKTQPISRLKDPAQKYLIFDAGGYVIAPAQALAPQYAYWYLPGYNPAKTLMYDGNFTGDSIVGRHSGRKMMNVVFADGHGETWNVNDFVKDVNKTGWPVP